MTVRLAFALVTAIKPDLLIIDEALAVGDQHFQKKCVERITDFRNKGCTILFCSHSPYHIRNLCDRALWLNAGTVEQFGDTEMVLAAYDAYTRQRDMLQGDAPVDQPILAGRADTENALPVQQGDCAQKMANDQSHAPLAVPQRADHAGACILKVDIADLAESSDGQPRLLNSRDLVVTLTVRGRGGECPHIGFMIEQAKGVGITSLGTHEEGAVPREIAPGVWQSVLAFPNLPLHTGDYVLSAYLFDATGLVVYDEWLHFLEIRFISPKLMPGLVQLPHQWS
jgi:lipopolysaccharide transport system ATP-binding protein